MSKKLTWQAMKPGMIIGCKDEGETKLLLEHLDTLGYVWINGMKIPEHKYGTMFRTFAICTDNKVSTSLLDEPDIQVSDLLSPEKKVEASNLSVNEWLTTYQGETKAACLFGEPCDLKSILDRFTADEITARIAEAF